MPNWSSIGPPMVSAEFRRVGVTKMPQVAAIYGFEFTRPFQAAGLTFTPASANHSAAKRLARALDAYNLTGTVTAADLGRELLYRLEAVLSFIEQLDVRISEPVADEAAVAHPHDFFELTVVGGARNNGGGAVIGSDAFNPWRSSRQQFVELALKRAWLTKSSADEPSSTHSSSKQSRRFGNESRSLRSRTSCSCPDWRRLQESLSMTMPASLSCP